MRFHVDREFRGPDGERAASIFLASPLTVAASAVAGRIAGADRVEEGLE